MTVSAIRTLPDADHAAPPRNLELFGGAGGLALGMHAAGFSLAGIVEHDAACGETLTANGHNGVNHTKGWIVYAEDVASFDYHKVGAINVLSAGAPCQPFSHGGQRLGEMDDRNQFPEIVRALHELKPDVFVIENVRGLLFRDMEIYFNALIRELKRPSRYRESVRRSRRGRPRDEYRVFWRILNAADFGLPQNRQRLFLVGVKPELAHLWHWPVGEYSKEALVKALVGNGYWEEHEVSKKVKTAVQATIAPATRKRAEGYEGTEKRWRTVRDLLRDLPDPAKDRDKADDPSHYFVPDARLYEKHTGSKLDWPAKTVKAGVHGCPGGEHIVVFDNGKYRYFSVRECALLQGFPPGYVFPWHRTVAMRQIGNAVPVPVATAVGQQLAEVVRGG